MIRLDEKTVHSRDVVDHGMVYVAKVGKDRERGFGCPDGESDRIGRVVRDGERGHLQTPHVECAARGKNAPFGTFVARVLRADLFGSEARGIDGTLQLAEQGRESTGVVTMLVGQQDGLDIGYGHARGLQAGKRFARTQSGVDHDCGPRGAENGSVAAAAAAKDEEFHGGGW